MYRLVQLLKEKEPCDFMHSNDSTRATDLYERTKSKEGLFWVGGKRKSSANQDEIHRSYRQKIEGHIVDQIYQLLRAPVLPETLPNSLYGKVRLRTGPRERAKDIVSDKEVENWLL